MLTVIFVDTVCSIVIIQGYKTDFTGINGQCHNNITMNVTNTDCQMK